MIWVPPLTMGRTSSVSSTPSSENGNGLSEVTCEILQGLKKADTEKIIYDTSVSAIDFDNDMNAIYRKVEFTMEFCLCEEV